MAIKFTNVNESFNVTLSTSEEENGIKKKKNGLAQYFINIVTNFDDLLLNFPVDPLHQFLQSFSIYIYIILFSMNAFTVQTHLLASTVLQQPLPPHHQ